MVNVIIDPGSITDVGAGSSGARAVLVGSIVALTMTVGVGSAELRGRAAVDNVAVAGATADFVAVTVSITASAPGSRSSEEPEAHAAKPATITSRIVQVRSHSSLTKH